MTPVDAFAPWLLAALILFLLLRTQKALQRRIFGVGWMVAAHNDAGAVLYTLVLLPGVALHEVVEWLTAGVLNFKTVRSMRWPEADKNGEIDPKFVTVEYPKRDPKLGPPGPAARLKTLFTRAIVEITPTLAGLAVILFICNNIVDFPSILKTFPSGDVATISGALGKALGRPDFWLWFYVLFTISNTMMPRRFARRGMLILGAVAAVFMLMLAIIGFARSVEGWLLGPIPSALIQLSTLFVSVLFVDFVFLLVIVALEALVERATQRQAPYKTAAAKALATRTARSTGPRLTSINQYLVPLPTIDAVRGIASTQPKPAPRPALPATPPASRPVLPEPERQPAIQPPAARPALPPPTASPPALPKPIEQPKPAEPRPVLSPTTAPAPAFGANKPAVTPSSAPAAAPRPAAPSSPFSQPAPTGNSTTLPPRPALPATASNPASANPPAAARPFAPAPKPATGALTVPPRPSPFATNPARTNADIIDAEVIPDDNEPRFAKDLAKPKKPDDGEARYEDAEEAP